MLLYKDEYQCWLENAVEDVRDSLSYYLNVVNTALDYYQNQLGGRIKGEVCLIGDGFRLAGIKKMFENEISLPIHSLDYSTFVDIKNNKALPGDEPVSTVGFLSIAGATINPIDVKSKEIEEERSRGKGMHTAYVALAACVFISVVLILSSSIRQFFAVSHQKELDEEISKMSYIEEVYNENKKARESEQKYEVVDASTSKNNENFLQLLGECEGCLPKGSKVRSLQIQGDSISMNIISTKRIQAERLLMNLKQVELIKNVSIPAVAQPEEKKKKSWEYTVMAEYNSDSKDKSADENKSQSTDTSSTQSE